MYYLHFNLLSFTKEDRPVRMKLSKKEKMDKNIDAYRSIVGAVGHKVGEVSKARQFRRTDRVHNALPPTSI